MMGVQAALWDSEYGWMFAKRILSESERARVSPGPGYRGHPRTSEREETRMSDDVCPKCSGPFDDGGASCSKGYFIYKSDRQDARTATTPIGKARACLQCGYVELFLDSAKLQENLQGKAHPASWIR